VLGDAGRFVLEEFANLIDEQFVNKRCRGAAKGLLIGVGIGLLTCDFLDLSGGDVTAFYGWLTGIAVGAIIGSTVGYATANSSSPFMSVNLGNWLLLLGSCILYERLLVTLTILREHPALVWSCVMVASGVAYLILGYFVRISSKG
jgi:hypothetical protein